LGGAYCPSDGQANPFLAVRAYAEAIRSSGGEILLRSRVVSIDASDSRVTAVSTADGQEYSAPIVVNAAGPFAKEIGQMVGLELPCEPERHEALVTERCNRLFDPMIVDYRPDGCYFNQTISTNQLIGCYTPDPRIEGTRVDSTLQFVKEMPRRMMRLLPPLRDVKVIRQWSGSYTMTPDGSPIVGPTPLEGFYVAVGMSGHGFMLGPALGRLLAELITTGTTSIPIDELAYGRSFQSTESFK
jgi:sarcosine oxidase subunit beta